LVPEGAASPQEQVNDDELSLPEGFGDDNFPIVDQAENEEPPGLEIRADDSDSEDEDEPEPNVQQSHRQWMYSKAQQKSIWTRMGELSSWKRPKTEATCWCF
jgi:hypothetical protein